MIENPKDRFSRDGAPNMIESVLFQGKCKYILEMSHRSSGSGSSSEIRTFLPHPELNRLNP